MKSLEQQLSHKPNNEERAHHAIGSHDDNAKGETSSEIARINLDDFFDQKMFRDFARGDGGVKVLSAQEAGMETDVSTAGIDLKNRKLYFNENFIGKLEPAERAFTVLHEGGHLKKLLELLDTKNGHSLYKSWHQEISEKRRYGLLDNCVADAGINKDVIEYAPVAQTAEQDLYKNHLFKIQDGRDILDMTNAPKHIQFAQIFPYEKAGRVARVSPEVRAKIDELKAQKNSLGVSLYDYITSADIPEDMRIKLQRKFLYPIVDEFFEQDLEEQNDKPKQGNDSKEDGGGDGETGEPQKEEGGQGKEESPGKSEKGNENDEVGGGNANNNEEGDDKEGESGEQNGGDSGKEGEGTEGGDGEKGAENPEDNFKEYYDALDKNDPHVIDPKEIEDAVERYIKASGKGAGKSDQQILDEAMAREGGVSTEDLQQYRNFWQHVERIKNPETNEYVVEELREMFRKIVNDRKKKRYVPKYPVKEGDILTHPSEAVVAVQSGEHEPEVWETIELKERPKEMYGDFDVTVVSDRSGSMSSTEVLEQKKAVALILESLTEFAEYLAEERNDLEYDLNIRTEAWSFGSSAQNERLKELSEELTEKQRVNVFKRLDDAEGDSTDDFVVLEKILENITEEEGEKMKEGKMKKIVIVTSDGGSSDSDRLKEVLKKLRQKGIIIAAVGITDSGKPVEEQYRPDGQICKDSSKLAQVLSDILKEHLDTL